MGFYYNSGITRDTIDAGFISEIGSLEPDKMGNIVLEDGMTIDANFSIQNNEEIKFDFSKISFKKVVAGTKFFKAKVEFGDGESKIISSFISDHYSVINSVWDDWTSLIHEYNFQENKPGALKITFYSTAGDVAKVELKFDIKFKSIYELGTNFELINANINSKNTVSYVLRHSNTDSIIIANS